MKVATVVDITPVGKKHVFDLEVAGHHNYVGNGILVHNCSYHDLLDYYGKKYNDEFYKVKDTFITYKHRRLLYYPAGPNKKTLRGRCLVGSTLVNTQYGFLRLSELIQDDGQVPNEMTVDTHNGRQQATHTYRDVTNLTYKITTHNGYTLQGTPEHPVYVLTPSGTYDWCKLEDVRPGMAIMSMGASQEPMWADLSSLSDDMLMTLAGNIFEVGNYPIEIRTAPKSINEKFIDLLLSRYAYFFEDTLVLALTDKIHAELQVMLLHGFNVVSTRKTNRLAIKYEQLVNCNFPATKSVISARLPAAVDNKQHHELISAVVQVVDTCDIFDLTVPQGHAFMANGLVSHNTRVFCLAANTLVNTSRGLVPIQDIKVGDEVWRGLSKRQVTSASFSGEQVVSTITLDNGLQIRSTKDHQFRVLEGSALTEKWVKAVDLKPHHHMLISLGGDFPEKDFSYTSKDGKTWYMNPGMAKLMAHLQRNTVNGKIVFDYDLIDKFEHTFANSPRVDLNHKEIFLDGVQLEVLTAFGYNGHKTGVPYSVLMAKEEAARCYLIECFNGKTSYTMPVWGVQLFRSLLLKFGIIGYSSHSEITLTAYEAGLLHNCGSNCSTKDLEAYAIPYSLHAFRKVYVRSELNHQMMTYKTEALRHADRIDKNIAYCRVHSFYSDWDTVPTYDLSVDHEDQTFTANGFVTHNSAIDEIGWFDNQNDGKVKMDATQVHVALDRSLLTVRAAASRLVRQGFNDIPTGYAFNVSSPSSARDKIVELVTQSRTSKKIFGFKCATWEMNPNITKDDLSEEYAKNPVDAERDYACNPPLSDNAFISSFPSIEGCFIGKPSKLRYKHAQKSMRDGSVTRYAVIDEIAKSTKVNVLAIDAGYSGNSFAAACAHMHEGLPIVNSLMEVMPNPGMPLNHALIFREALHTIIKERNVKLLLADRWQSIKLLQDAELEFEGLMADQYSLKYDDFWILKQMMFDSEVIFPRLKRPIDEILKFDQSKYPYCFPDPSEHLAVQCITVRDMGNSIDKGDGLTDDVFRASSLAVMAFQMEKYADLFEGDGGLEEVMKGGALGHMVGRSGGVSSTGREVHVSTQGKAIGVMSSKR